jgi:hypothetical protein
MQLVSSMLWRRLDLPGHDACRLWQQANGWHLQGSAVFRHHNGPAHVCYAVRCDPRWRTVSGRIHGFIGQISLDYRIIRRASLWRLNGIPVAGLGHLLDLDLGFTPATNLLQLRRVRIEVNEIVSLPVAWFDPDSGTLTELPRIYEHRRQDAFWYKAPGAGYEGLLELAPNGFIRRYPGLWVDEVPDQG